MSDIHSLIGRQRRADVATTVTANKRRHLHGRILNHRGVVKILS